MRKPIRINIKQQTSFFIEKNDTIESYFSDIKKYPVLDIDEEKRLLYSYKNGETQKEREEARAKLINSNLRFVISLARKMGTKETLTDLIAEGNIGLIKAIEKFDMEKDCRLITYASSWITACIRKYQTTLQNAVTPPNSQKITNLVNKVNKDFFMENERKPFPEEIMHEIKKKYNFNVTCVEDVELGTFTSIDEAIDNKDEFNDTLNLYNERTSTNNVEVMIDDEYIRASTNFYLNRLNERERSIVMKKLGIGGQERSLSDIAKEMCLCKESVRQIYNAAINKLRKEVKIS